MIGITKYLRTIRGIRYYQKTIEKCLTDERSRAFVIGNASEEIYEAFLRAVRLYRVRQGISSVTIFIANEKYERYFAEGIDSVVKLSDSKYKSLIELYNLYQFDNRVIFLDRHGINGRIVPENVTDEKYVLSLILDLNSTDISRGKKYINNISC